MTPRGQGSGRALAKTKLLLTPALDPVTEPQSPRDQAGYIPAPARQRLRAVIQATTFPSLSLPYGTVDMSAAVCDTRELQFCVSNTDMNKGPTGVWYKPAKYGVLGTEPKDLGMLLISAPSDTMKEEERKPHWVHSTQVGVGRVSSLSYLLPTNTKARHAQDGPLPPQMGFCWSGRKQKTEGLGITGKP